MQRENLLQGNVVCMTCIYSTVQLWILLGRGSSPGEFLGHFPVCNFALYSYSCMMDNSHTNHSEVYSKLVTYMYTYMYMYMYTYMYMYIVHV